MKAVIGEEALSEEIKYIIDILEKFERQYLTQNRYKSITSIGGLLLLVG